MGNALLEGVKVTGPVTNLAVAAAAGAAAVYTLGANWIGTKSLKIKKVMYRNNAGGQTYLHVGTGVGGAFVDVIDPIVIMNNQSDSLVEAEIVQREAFATITAYPEALAGGGSVDVQVEVEEIG
jgi:hypothetical protein